MHADLNTSIQQFSLVFDMWSNSNDEPQYNEQVKKWLNLSHNLNNSKWQ